MPAGLLKVSQNATLTGCGAEWNWHAEVPLGELTGVAVAVGGTGVAVAVGGTGVAVAVGGTDVAVAVGGTGVAVGDPTVPDANVA